MKYSQLFFILLNFSLSFGQVSDQFNYELTLEAISIDGFNGLHSFAVGSSGTKYLLIGGRKDGIHARQPFNAFPANYNNDSLFVLDINSNEFWASSLEDLEENMQEQLQSSNMNFYQDSDTLILIGGYAYSNINEDHITFPFLTKITVSTLIDAIVNQQDITPYFNQIEDEKFAVCGGQLAMIEDEYLLVGGHKFDGRYNPMGHPTYTQTYTDQIRKFKLDFEGNEIIVNDFKEITDPIHLHRRDYNLLPQIFPNNTFGYTIFSGVFQLDADLPFLYPVHVYKNGIEAIPSFNQFLSNYHSAKVSLYDVANKQMHNLFFGGISQYYYEESELIEDQDVPFVSTISRVSLYEDGSMKEYKLNTEMPLFQGSSAEFIFNSNVPLLHDQIIDLSALDSDKTTIGYIIGGIYSATKNPFNANNVSNTAADFNIYAVNLNKSTSSGNKQVDGINPFELRLFPNPSNGAFNIIIDLDRKMEALYYISTPEGKIIQSKAAHKLKSGMNQFEVMIDSITTSSSILNFTLVLDQKYYLTKKIIID